MSVVIRLSSVIIENKILLSNFAENLEILVDNGLNLIVIHEYGNLLTKQLKLLGIDDKKYSPHFGDDKLSGLFEMVISGHINKRIVSKLCSLGVMAIGLSGKDGNLLVAKKSNHIAINDSWLYASEPLLVNPEILLAIEDTKIVPIISPVACTDKGKTAILDTDITSAMAATAVNANKLIIMCENDFLINNVATLSSVTELNDLLNSTIEVAVTDPLVKASKSIIPDSKTNTGSRTDTIAAFSELIYFNPFNNNNIGKAVQIIAIKVIFNQLFLSGITKLPSKHATIKHAMLQPINTIENRKVFEIQLKNNFTLKMESKKKLEPSFVRLGRLGDPIDVQRQNVELVLPNKNISAGYKFLLEKEYWIRRKLQVSEKEDYVNTKNIPLFGKEYLLLNVDSIRNKVHIKENVIHVDSLPTYHNKTLVKFLQNKLLVEITDIVNRLTMSGGVDSSVVAAMMHEQGHRVIGITLQLYDHGAVLQKKGACCAGQDIYDAKMVADRIGIPHYVLNYENLFRQKVIDDFVDSYARGETPLPCVRCNQSVKFKDLLKFAKELGGDALATGHYVQKIINHNTSELHRGLDPYKDQSYFLFSTTNEQLDFLDFPLGKYTKEETRKLALKYGLEVADKPDSQDICFVPGGNYREIVTRMRPSTQKPALAYTELATMLPTSGSIYTYSYVAFGEVFAWLIGSLIIIELGFASSAVAGGLATGIIPYAELNNAQPLAHALKFNNSNIGSALVATGGIAAPKVCS
eukprot:jgi/Mesvir1/25216/Mv20284-RA.1